MRSRPQFWYKVAGEQILIFFGVFAIFLVIAILVWQAEKKRTEALRTIANSLGLSFEKRGGRDLLANVGFLAAMPKGSGGHTRNVFSGQYKGLDVRLFEYVYTTGSGKNKQTHHHEVAWARLPADFPGLTIVPEHLGHKLFDAIGGDDIDFESDEFSRRFWVRCGDRRFAYDVIHGRMMEHLMAAGFDRWHLRGPYLCGWKQQTRLDPHEVQPDLDRLAAFYGLMPSFRRPEQIRQEVPA